jgi:transposase, IS30 family
MGKFTQLSYQEREQIYTGLCKRKTLTEMSRELNRNKSTLSREIRRNSDSIGYLYPKKAHKLAQDRRNKNKAKIDKDENLKKYIIKHLQEGWSPKTIAGRLNKESPSSKITAETIYRWIYNQKPFYDRGIPVELRKCLLRARKKRGLKRKPSKSDIKEKVSIHDRPSTVNERIEYGHYEGDLIFNRGSQSKNVLTLVERTTREAILIKNDNKRSDTVIDALISFIKKNKLIIKTITFDNGSEFAEHKKLITLGIKIYFCDPGSPWQKGSIENLNGIIRRFIPFKISAFSLTEDQIKEVTIKINAIPRAILGFKTPLEAYTSSLASL